MTLHPNFEKKAHVLHYSSSKFFGKNTGHFNPVFTQEAETDSGADEDGKSKFKRRPRPEPLIIPPPKASSFIPPSLYSSITSYQSNLRSPIRLPENPHSLPPYTPPPILSPVRGGSGLYFSAFLTNMASNQILPPPVTPKSATRSLLRSGMFWIENAKKTLPQMMDQVFIFCFQ